MKLKFNVTKDVLIPREDTEILVQEAIKTDKKKILDMCTGSGCIAISLAKYIADSCVDAVDISLNALEIASRNAKFNSVKVNFIESNLFENVADNYDLIVSNPPYIPSEDIKGLQVEVQNEPSIALDGGSDGLHFYKRIAEDAKYHLTPSGILMFEIGYDEAEAVASILYKNGYIEVQLVKDLSGNDRVLIAKRGSN